MPRYDGEKTSILLKGHYLRRGSQESLHPVHGLVQLRLRGQWPAKILPGDEVVIRCTLNRPYSFGNPGGFDYPAFLQAQNIYLSGRISSTAHIHALQTPGSWLHSLRYLPERLRLSIRDKINTTLPPKEAALYRALLIGDRSGLSPKQLESFKAAGVFHILAISGLHLSLVASGLFFVFYWLARRSSSLMLSISVKKLALLGTIPPLCVYALLAGSQTPVMRSLIMVLVFILAFCVRKQGSPFTTLSLAALLILVLNPQSLFTLSFQLSFAAVASLIMVLPIMKNLLLPPQEHREPRSSTQQAQTRLQHWLGVVLLISMAATIGTAPLLIYGFNRLSTVGPLANIVIEPLLCLFSLPLGLLSLLFMPFSVTLGEGLLHLGAFGIRAAGLITETLAGYDASTLWLATPDPLLMILYYISLSAALYSSHRKKCLLLFLASCGLFIFPPSSLLGEMDAKSELVFLDVGQGSSTLLSFPGNRRVLVDGGGSGSPRFDVGGSIIAPYLWSRGITRLESVVITHPDSDHFNGIPFILKRFQPKTLWINGNDGHGQEYDDLLEIAKEMGIDILQPKNNEILLEWGEVELRNIPNPIAHRSPNEAAAEAISSNDESLILKFTDRSSTQTSFSCLFPGDISASVEEELLRKTKSGALAASFLLAPHHGSKTSNSIPFLQGVRPRAIIVSAGSFRPTLFPSTKLRLYCRDHSIPLINTATMGAIRIQRIDDTLQMSHYDKMSHGFKAIAKKALLP
jgi:competence protein ComEC